MNWSEFVPSDFEYDFENDKLWYHRVTFEEAVECFFSGWWLNRKWSSNLPRNPQSWYDA